MAVAKVAKADAAADTPSLFARRLTKLEAISVQLRGLYRDYHQSLVAEKQYKAQVYLNSEAKSHGEREGQASAHAIHLSVETLLIKGEIARMEEERSFLRFLIEWDSGE